MLPSVGKALELEALVTQRHVVLSLSKAISLHVVVCAVPSYSRLFSESRLIHFEVVR